MEGGRANATHSWNISLNSTNKLRLSIQRSRWVCIFDRPMKKFALASAVGPLLWANVTRSMPIAGSGASVSALIHLVSIEVLTLSMLPPHNVRINVSMGEFGSLNEDVVWWQSCGSPQWLDP